jgi:hypothetical protein
MSCIFKLLMIIDVAVVGLVFFGCPWPPFYIERISCAPLKIIKILNLPLKKLSSRLYHCFKI